MSKPTTARILGALPLSERQVLDQVIQSADFSGVIRKHSVDQLLDMGVSINDLLLKLMRFGSCYAQPAISDFHVGAALLGESGNIYLGANLEITGHDLAYSIHAEQSALNNALLHGEKGVTHIAISAAPCGHCRQFLNEINEADTLQLIVAGQDVVTLKHLLPYSFGPQDLGVKRALFNTDLEAAKVNTHMLAELRKFASDDLVAQSYAPYTGAYSYLILQSESETTLGVYIENAAYNPSFSPFMSALDRLRFNGGKVSDIRKAILFELDDAKISHSRTVTALLSSIAPTAELVVINCSS